MLRGLKFHFDNLYVSEAVPYGPVLLWQVGDVGCDPGYVVKDHEQYCYEITCVVDGKGTISSDRKTFDIGKGQVYLNRPGEIHRICSDLSDPIRFFYLGFDFEQQAGDAVFQAVQKTMDSCQIPLRADRNGIQNVFSALFDEMITNDAMSQKMIGYYIHQIILLFARELEQRDGEKYVSGGGMEASRQLVYSIVNYIDANLCSIEHLEDLGNQVGYSYSYVSRLFRQVMGCSIRDYYNERRFEKAVSLLKEGLKTTEIAGRLHYQSLHSFSKAFRNHFGMSPTAYRAGL